MNRSLLGMVVVLTSLWAGPIRAQTSAPILASTEPPVDEVERGVFFGLDIGPAFLSVFFAGNTYSANADYVGNSGGTASGDFSSISSGLAVRWNFLGFADSQGVQRTWLYLKAGGGFALLKPNALFATNPVDSYGSILVFGGPGLQYYTRLRHFSVGVEVVGSYLLKPKTFGFAITPNLRYAF